jgi:hypothetical protein
MARLYQEEPGKKLDAKISESGEETLPTMHIVQCTYLNTYVSKQPTTKP